MTDDKHGAESSDDARSATFDQTGGLMREYEGEGDDDRDQDPGPEGIGNLPRPGGQAGGVGDVADGEEPHLDPDEQNP
jgi:hypothetical protein